MKKKKVKKKESAHSSIEEFSLKHSFWFLDVMGGQNIVLVFLRPFPFIVSQRKNIFINDDGAFIFFVSVKINISAIISTINRSIIIINISNNIINISNKSILIKI